jgi:hypothetical protein
MPYSETTANRIREILHEKGADFFEKKMFSGICFMVDNKMCCATHIDKKTSEDVLLCRVGEKVYAHVIERDDVIPMEFTGKAMKGYIYVLESGIKKKKDLAHWLQLCLDFNPLAKPGKKK